MTSDWLDSRIAEVVALAKRDLGVIGSGSDVSRNVDVNFVPGRHSKIVVAMKLRMNPMQWEQLKEEWQGWLKRGIHGRFMARYEADHPNWYDGHMPSVGGESYNPNNRIG